MTGPRTDASLIEVTTAPCREGPRDAADPELVLEPRDKLITRRQHQVAISVPPSVADPEGHLWSHRLEVEAGQS